MARVKPEENRNVDENDLVGRAKKYSFLKSQLDYLEKEQKALRVDLFETIDTDGEEDSKGNIVLELPEEVDGYVSIMKQRRVSRKVNELKAEEIIEAKGLEDKLYKTIRVIDEDALMAALYNDELTEEEIEEIYPQSVVWALVMNKR
jgi:hypothetical protein